jgi:hypothetical protein
LDVTGQTRQAECLLYGFDTVKVAYYFCTGTAPGIDFVRLGAEKEALRASRTRDPKALQLGNMEFLLQPYGTASGYSFVLTNADYAIELSEFLNPACFVTFRSEALWRESAGVLHERIMAWADSVGLVSIQRESLSRVDFCFDYHLPELDFDEDSFVSRSHKDSQHRNRGRVQTFTLGKSDIVLRVYDKVAEIHEVSGKTWFFDLWQRETDVWRIEWQVRKPILKRFGIRTFDELRAQQGDVLRYLAQEHDTLRRPSADRNRSRWPLHPLWRALQAQIDKLDCLGIYRVDTEASTLAERATRIMISMNGNLKRLAAIHCCQTSNPTLSQKEALEHFSALLLEIQDPFSWRADVEKRATEVRLGK